jgi:hypothetical protein
MKIRFLLPVIALLFIFCSCSDKILLEKFTEIEKAVNDELVASCSNGKIAEYVAKNSIKGEYVMDITVEGKGRTLTVTAISNQGGNIPSQNALKDFLCTYVYNFKMKPGQREKVRHTFKF